MKVRDREIWLIKGELDSIPLDWPYYILSLSSMALMIASALKSRVVLATVMVVFLLSAVIFLKRAMRRRKLDAEVIRRLESVPWWKVDAAKTLCGDDYLYAAIECQEAHLDGDCPLCGAV